VDQIDVIVLNATTNTSSLLSKCKIGYSLIIFLTQSKKFLVYLLWQLFARTNSPFSASERNQQYQCRLEQVEDFW